MADKLSILFAEDLTTDYELAIYEIKKTNPKIVGKRVDTEEEYIDAINNFNPDIIISDYIMPQFNGMKALMIKMELCPDIPFIMLTGSTNEETAVNCMKAGADDYVIKEHIRRLPLCVSNALINAKTKREIKQTQQELVRREALLRNAVNNLTSSFTIYDSEGRIEYINQFGLILSGLSQKEAVGKKEEEIFPVEITRNYISALYRAYETKESQITECEITYKNGTYYIAYYFVPSLDENNNIYKVIGLTFDITERKEAEDNLKIAVKRAEEYDQLKSAFLANISHEIRTPLNAIMGFTQLIKKGYSNDDLLSGYADIIMLSSNQLLDIIKEILEISQLISGKSNLNYTEFSLSELINELFVNFQFTEEAKIKRGINFKLDKENKKDILIVSDREKIYQIIKNLLSNAFKFTFSGEINIGYSKNEKGFVTFYVSDTGIGIESAKIDLIFDIFRQGDETFSRQYGGVGLGLTICRELVHLLGGKIWVESEYMKGSVFKFKIPEKVKV